LNKTGEIFQSENFYLGICKFSIAVFIENLAKNETNVPYLGIYLCCESDNVEK
jgi:hypothetical protein